jgi:putative ABC transport system ATP-binding protein
MDGIDICDLTIEYDSAGYLVRPIDHLDLQVGSGELVLLLGASGSGKTTVLSALAAILRPTAGTIRVGEVEVTTLRGAALTEYRRHRVGVVFQTFNLVPSLLIPLTSVVAWLPGQVHRGHGCIAVQEHIPGRRARS